MVGTTKQINVAEKCNGKCGTTAAQCSGHNFPSLRGTQEIIEKLQQDNV